MGHKSFKPYTPGRRQMTVSSFDEITTNRPENHFWLLFIIMADVIIPERRQYVIRVADINVSTELLILREIKIIFRQQLQP